MAGYRNGPAYSCPEIDEAIDHMEAVRKINRQLRDDNEQFEAGISERDNEINKLSERIAELEDELIELRDQLEPKE